MYTICLPLRIVSMIPISILVPTNHYFRYTATKMNYEREKNRSKANNPRKFALIAFFVWIQTGAVEAGDAGSVWRQIDAVNIQKKIDSVCLSFPLICALKVRGSHTQTKVEKKCDFHFDPDQCWTLCDLCSVQCTHTHNIRFWIYN